MSHRAIADYLLDVYWPTAFKAISGNASGTTPKVSAWIRLKEVNTIALAFVTGASTNVVWTAEVATGDQGQNAKALPNPPTWPTGTAQNGSATVTMPGDEFVFLRVTGTPSAGSAAVEMTPGLITGYGCGMHRIRQAGVLFSSPDTMAGQFALLVSGNFDGKPKGIGPKAIATLENGAGTPALWTTAADYTNTAISIAATTAGQALYKTLGMFNPMGVLATYTGTSGFGTIRCWINGKG